MLSDEKTELLPARAWHVINTAIVTRRWETILTPPLNTAEKKWRLTLTDPNHCIHLEWVGDEHSRDGWKMARYYKIPTHCPAGIEIVDGSQITGFMRDHRCGPFSGNILEMHRDRIPDDCTGHPLRLGKDVARQARTLLKERQALKAAERASREDASRV